MHENQVQAETVDFYGNELITVLYRDSEYVAMKPIVEGMGLSWPSQQIKIKTSQRYHAILVPLLTNGGIQDMLCMPLTKLNGWLFSISPEKVGPEMRLMVELYQEECFIVLYNYWYRGNALNPRTNKEYQQITIATILSETRSAAELYRILAHEDGQARHFICEIIKAIYGIDCLSLLFSEIINDPPATYGKETRPVKYEEEPPLPDKKEIYLTPTELGRRLGLSPQRTNMLLEKRGIIESYRNKQNHLRWRPTKKGRPYVMPEHIKKKPDGSRRQCLMFSEAVIEIITQKKD